MRVFLIFICGIALVSLAPEVHAGKHKDKKSGHGGTASKSAQKAQAKSADWTKPKGGGKAYGRNNGSGQPVATGAMEQARRRRQNEASEHLEQPEQRHALQEGKELEQRE